MTEQQMLSLRTERDALLAIVDCFTLAVLLLDGSGRIVRMNRCARRLLEKDDGLSLGSGRLRTLRPEENAALQALLAEAQAHGHDGRPRAAGSLALSRRSTPRPLAVMVVPIATNGASEPHEVPPPLCAVFIGDPDPGCDMAETTLRCVYKLTATEARLTCLLVQGRRLSQAAEALHISSNTARGHLKKIFAKTEVRSQSDLVRLVLSGPARLQFG